MVFHGLSGSFYFISNSLKPNSGSYKKWQLEFNERERIIRVVTKIATNEELRSGYESSNVFGTQITGSLITLHWEK